MPHFSMANVDLLKNLLLALLDQKSCLIEGPRVLGRCCQELRGRPSSKCRSVCLDLVLPYNNTRAPGTCQCTALTKRAPFHSKAGQSHIVSLNLSRTATISLQRQHIRLETRKRGLNPTWRDARRDCRAETRPRRRYVETRASQALPALANTAIACQESLLIP